ncbi:tyrosinase family oxidase copper chaperone [Streptomyces sp. NPDC007929]|uniref:tyrosinase family oxidase copper chaperone n=1 Tax=unclassified Streptomyces TaxID=2593676 RepID=UPI0036E8B28A
MVVGVGGVPVGAAGDGGVRDTRRGVLRGLMAAAAGAALIPLALAAWPEETDGKHTGLRAGDGMFEETYRGRLIRGVPIPDPRQRAGEEDWHVTVDGRPLHLMRRADGSWLSMVDHYRSYPTPLAATRAAVDELGPGRHLRDLPGHAPGHLEGGAHGVHA